MVAKTTGPIFGLLLCNSSMCIGQSSSACGLPYFSPFRFAKFANANRAGLDHCSSFQISVNFAFKRESFALNSDGFVPTIYLNSKDSLTFWAEN